MRNAILIINSEQALWPVRKGKSFIFAYLLNAESLAVSRSWNPQEIKQVAIATLEILVYLQSQGPPVIHRDIKPENILGAAQK